MCPALCLRERRPFLRMYISPLLVRTWNSIFRLCLKIVPVFVLRASSLVILLIWICFFVERVTLLHKTFNKMRTCIIVKQTEHWVFFIRLDSLGLKGKTDLSFKPKAKTTKHQLSQYLNSSSALITSFININVGEQLCTHTHTNNTHFGGVICKMAVMFDAWSFFPLFCMCGRGLFVTPAWCPTPQKDTHTPLSD